MRAHAKQLGLDIPAERVFDDDEHPGATLVRPALAWLRDLAAQSGERAAVLCAGSADP
jgi:hypothetical protein